MKENFIFTDENLSEISFPLGGIGTGCIGLSGNGQIKDWEIYNSPNKRSYNHFSGFFVKAYRDGKLIGAKALNSSLLAPYIGDTYRNEALHSGYGFGPNEKSFAGFPHFDKLSFKGEFPIADLSFSSHDFPGIVHLKAFNPFIPMNERDSSIPAAFFEISFENTSEDDLEFAVCLVVSSSFDFKDSKIEYGSSDAVKYIKLGTESISEESPSFGDITIASDAEDISYQQYWYRGQWKDNLEMFWNDFTKEYRLRNRIYDSETSLSGRDTACLASHKKVLAGGLEKSRFLISWSYPNIYNSWNSEADKRPWKNYYASIFEDSVESAIYSFHNWDDLSEDTLKFKEALFSSSLDEDVKDAVASNLSVLKSPTCLRLQDGSFYGFEGCMEDVGSCEGSCTHVWNYTYALPFLFPNLERSMRINDYTYNQRDDGRMSFRLMLPLGSPANDFRACVDGQMGGVIKTYRDWKISGDDDFLKKIWPKVKKSLEYAWAATNEDKWDMDMSGVMTGRQHHTLDMELFGPNSWLNGFYLGALKAGSIMADYLGEDESSKLYRELFEKGKKYTDEHLFNGEYFCQIIDLEDKAILDQFDDEEYDSFIEAYWNDESGEIKYQVGSGCGIDQVLAQWHANLNGLGEIFDREKTKKALKSLYKYNFKRADELSNVWRIFSINEEEGLIMCSWPDEDQRPAIPLTYNTETMTGFEYQAACHMIQEGLLEEGKNIVRAIRDRYDGKKRNPWNEIECGSNYARSMASYSLLLSFSGFKFDMTENFIGFDPIEAEGDYSFFWSLDKSWGTFERAHNSLNFNVYYNDISLKTFGLPRDIGDKVKAISYNGQDIEYMIKGDKIEFTNHIKLHRDSSLVISL